MRRTFSVSFTLLLIVFISASCFGQSDDDLAGLIGRINPRGLSLIKDIVVGVISSQIGEFKIPSIAGKAIVNYNLSSLDITHFQVVDTALSASPPNILTADITDAALFINGDFKLSRRFLGRTISTDGSFRAFITGFTFTQGVAIGKDSSGRPTIVPVRCRTRIGRLVLRFSENSFAGWLNIGLKFGDDAIKDVVESLICPGIKDLVTGELRTLLNQFDAILPLPLNTNLDFGLVRPPVIMDGSLEIAINGRCFPADQPDIRYNFSMSPMMPLPRSNTMYQVSVSDYVINTFLATIINHDIFSQTFTEDQVRDAINFDFSVKTLSFIVPDLIQYIGKPVQFLIRPPKAPKIKLMAGSIQILGYYDAVAQVVLRNNAYYDALTISAAINATGNISINSNIISGRFDDLDIKIIDSGAFPSSVLQAAIAGLMELTILPGLNNITEGGYLIPSFYSFRINDAQLKLKKNAVQIATDLLLGSG